MSVDTAMARDMADEDHWLLETTQHQRREEHRNQATRQREEQNLRSCDPRDGNPDAEIDRQAREASPERAGSAEHSRQQRPPAGEDLGVGVARVLVAVGQVVVEVVPTGLSENERRQQHREERPREMPRSVRDGPGQTGWDDGGAEEQHLDQTNGLPAFVVHVVSV